jgi:phosphopantothenoylcysteine decarboxylase
MAHTNIHSQRTLTCRVCGTYPYYLFVCFHKKTSLLRALAPTTPTYIYPAMNTFMYEHPLTALHIRTIQEVIGYNVVEPVSKNLACGDVGVGAMVEWRDIVAAIVDKFLLVRDLDREGTSTRP